MREYTVDDFVRQPNHKMVDQKKKKKNKKKNIAHS